MDWASRHTLAVRDWRTCHRTVTFLLNPCFRKLAVSFSRTPSSSRGIDFGNRGIEMRSVTKTHQPARRAGGARWRRLRTENSRTVDRRFFESLFSYRLQVFRGFHLERFPWHLQWAEQQQRGLHLTLLTARGLEMTKPLSTPSWRQANPAIVPLWSLLVA